MSITNVKSGIAVRLFFVLLLACLIAVPAVPAAGPGNASLMTLSETDLNITYNGSVGDLVDNGYRAEPTPITIFRAELNQSTLPGPRDMGYGPSVIGLSIDPRVLAVIFAVILIGLVLWFVCFREKGGKNE
ncbi:hypothetical protein [Methanoregula sp.]|uniref:hypothetical protein n=1 Tax=Methanoregula sp. TaxID=2052170 RepID=UPI002371DE45|nr:hypothetical protein [Methanoregula sp.]MDD1685411.1 hypothetical protein [Methanoregula sp.]